MQRKIIFGNNQSIAFLLYILFFDIIKKQFKSLQYNKNIINKENIIFLGIINTAEVFYKTFNRINRRTRDKYESFSCDIRKLLIVPKLLEILKTSKYKTSSEKYKERTDNLKIFHYFKNFKL